MTPSIPVTASELRRLIVEPSRFVADQAAFVDIRLPRSAGKASYSFIGPGVSQNPGQTINITTPHGFNIGAASMDHGVVNNPHLHFTAEVFICTRGSWRFAVGQDGEQTIDVGPNTVFSVPTWVFRGFENTGADDGWLFTVLGGDDTGGILWAPRILVEAAETGMYLTPEHEVLDENNGDRVEETIAPLAEADLANIDRYSDEELDRRAVRFDQLKWSGAALLSTKTPSGRDHHRCALAPVIGYGMTEDRHHQAPVINPHGFSVEWLAVEPGSSSGLHRHGRSQALFCVDGDWTIELNHGQDLVAADAAPGSVVSIPPGAWRDFRNSGSATAYAIVVNEGDDRTVLEWDDEIIKEATDAGWDRDANGYLAPAGLLGRNRR